MNHPTQSSASAQPAWRSAAPARVLFLDFDGVITTPRSHLALTQLVRGQGGLMIEPDPVALALLHKLGTAGVRIVVSSSWRLNEPRCLDFLSLHELRFHLHSDWRTPDLSRDAGGVYIRPGRGAEIAAWLDRHPEVRSYRILDDDTGMQPEQMPYFIRCEAHEGISYQGAKHLLRWAGLLGEPKEAA